MKETESALMAPPESRPRIIKERKNLGRGEFEAMRYTPRQEQGESQYPVPLLFVHGHGQDPTLERYLQLFGQTGRDTVGVGYPKRRTSKDVRRRMMDSVSVKVPPYQYEKAEDILSAMNSMGVGQADIVATSEGALRALIAVSMHPEKFRNIILVHPAGMDDRGSLVTSLRAAYHYGRRFLRKPHLFTERVKRGSWKTKGAKEIRREQQTIGRTRLHSLMAELHNNHPHLLFSIIGDKRDRIFTAKRLRRINEENLFTFHTSDWGGHGIGLQPKNVNEIVGLLQQMEQSRTDAKIKE